MHALPRHENEYAKCGYYCLPDDNIHVDVIYLMPWVLEQASENLLGYIKEAWRRRGYTRTSEVLAIAEAPEAEEVQKHYPLSYRSHPGHTKPFKITYRVVTQNITTEELS